MIIIYLTRLSACLLDDITETTLKVKVFAWSPFGDQFFWFRETSLQIKILGTMATKMVATWGVLVSMLMGFDWTNTTVLHNYFNL